MKQFLIDKLASYSREMADDFHFKITNHMPTFKTWPKKSTIWDSTDDGLWAIVPIYNDNAITELEAYFYHNNGDIFSLSSQYDKSYFDMYQRLYVACVSQKPQTLRVMRPIEFETVSVNVESLNSTLELNYIKFESPAGETGSICTNTLDATEIFNDFDKSKLFADIIRDLFITLKTLGYLFPEDINVIGMILIDSQGPYLRLIPPATASLELVLSQIEDSEFMNNSTQSEISNYWKTICQQLKN